MKRLLCFQKYYIRSFNREYFNSKQSYRTIKCYIIYEVSSDEIRSKFVCLFMIVNQQNDELFYELYTFQKA